MRKLLAALLCMMTTIAQASDIAAGCGEDLATLPKYIEENDSGGKAHLANRGKEIATAFEKAKADAIHVKDDKKCVSLLNSYLKSWRSGHLRIQGDIEKENLGSSHSETTTVAEGEEGIADLDMPSLQWKSKKTVLLRMPSFDNKYREPLQLLLNKNRSKLEQRPYWIIDVRENGGGSDGTYEVLLPWVLPTQRVEYSASWFSTEANIVATLKACPIFAPGDAGCISALEDAAARMKKVPSGTYVAQYDKDSVAFNQAKNIHAVQPQRIAVLISEKCGSSCEQFVLSIRQGFNVTILGRPSYGALDYSNLRPYDLPSGKRRLWYATSRSARAELMPIDGFGCQPDILLPKPNGPKESDEEVEQVRRWVESGSWK